MPDLEPFRIAVRRRAGARCEYCHLPDDGSDFEVDHVTAIKHDGRTELANLAWSCERCNSHKSANLSGLDRHGGRERIVRLFHPRRDRWNKHFQFQGAILVGLTAIGRVTIRVLEMNEAFRVQFREELIAAGWNPSS